MCVSWEHFTIHGGSGGREVEEEEIKEVGATCNLVDSIRMD
jgi:hypothetical protein